jgi:hypothetical protein
MLTSMERARFLLVVTLFKLLWTPIIAQAGIAVM